MIDNLVSGLIGASFSLLVWFLVWLIFFFNYFLKEPAAIYNNQKAALEKLKLELNPDHPFEITIRPPENPKAGRVNVGVDIRNTSALSVTFTVCVRTKDMSNPEILMPILMYHVAGDDYTNIKLNRKTIFPFYFACAETGSSIAVLNTISDNHRRIYPGSYELSIELEGENASGKPIANSVSFILVYEGDDKLELRNK